VQTIRAEVYHILNYILKYFLYL